MKKKLLCGLLSLTLLVGASIFPVSSLGETAVPDVTTLYKERDVTDAWDASSAVAITLRDTEADFPADAGVSLSGGVLTITAKGTYVLSGTFAGRVEVAADKEKNVQLVLSGVSIVSPEGPAILVRSADKVVVTLAEGSENALTDAAALTEGEESYNAALYSCDDLSINGSGALTVTGNVKNGINCKNDLVLAGGVLTVSAVNDGVRGKDSLVLLGGTVTVTAGGDALVSDDETDATHGIVYLAGGSYTLQSGGGAGEATVSAGQEWGRSWGGQSAASTSDNEASMKGVKAYTALYVTGGVLDIDAADDALHSQSVVLTGGDITVKTGDDGVHADAALTITGGVLNITQSYEGLEATDITIAGGDISVVSSDDGVNGSGGNDGSGVDSGWGFGFGDSFASGSATVTITGGVLRVNAEGDGLDSNGSITQTGGEVYISGPSNSGNGALDYNTTYTLTGGILMAAGASGMAQNVSSAENQAALLVSGNGAAGAVVTLTDESGNVLASFTPDKAWQCIVLSAPGLATGSTCTVTAGSTAIYSGTVSSSVSGGGSSGGFGGGFGGGHGGFGGGGGGKR